MDMPQQVLLLIDDDDVFRTSLASALAREYKIIEANSSEQARTRSSPAPDAVLLVVRLDADNATSAQGVEFLRELRQEWPSVPVIMVTGYGDVSTAVECIREGAVDFVEKIADLRTVRARLAKALEHAQLSRRVGELEKQLAIVEPRQLVGQSSPMQEVKKLVGAVSKHGEVTVLIQGETGTGKELVARAIHASGPRKKRPFVAVAVSALATTTVESELFGHERGAFTGAHDRHVGYIEKAHGGVLFLDEIDTLQPSTQVKLLRFLEERVITRLGGTRELPVDVQIIAATNANLDRIVAEGTFRRDLFYRLKVFEIRVPSLRERRDDIALLTEFYLDAFKSSAHGVSGAEPAVLKALREHDWPGNGRELRNTIESALLRAALRGHRRVQTDDLPGDLNRNDDRTSTAGSVLDEALARAELAEVERALDIVGGKKTDAWKVLGLNDRYALRRRVHRILERYPDLVTEFKNVGRAYGVSRRKALEQ